MNKQPTRNVIIVSHGVTIRAFVMMWCKFSAEWFDGAANPPNCSVRLLDSSVVGSDAGYIYPGLPLFETLTQTLSYSRMHAEQNPLVDLPRL